MKRPRFKVTPIYDVVRIRLEPYARLLESPPPSYSRRLLRWLAASTWRAVAAVAWLTLVAGSVAYTWRNHP